MMRQPIKVSCYCGILLMALSVPTSLAALQRGGNRIPIEAGAPCPPGTTEVRPLQCQAPEMPAPSIVDYRPQSTLVAEEHRIPRAKYPVVDIHGHMNSLADPGVIEAMVGELDALNIQVYVAADNMRGERLERTLEAIQASPHRDRFRVLAGINFGDMEPGWGQRAASEIEAAIAAGAIGVGEVSKSFGLTRTKPDGSRLRVDDPDLDPVWKTLARLGAPAFIHTAEPPEFFEAPDYENERWLELALFPNRRNYGPDHVGFDALMRERDNLFRNHPDTQFIAAHFGWHANDLGRAADYWTNFRMWISESAPFFMTWDASRGQ